MIKQQIDFESGRRGGLHLRQLGFYRIDDVERRTVAVLDNLEQYSAFAVGPDNIRLDFKPVMHMGDVPHISDDAIIDLDWEIVQGIEDVRRVVHADGILSVADLRGATGQSEILRE